MIHLSSRAINLHGLREDSRHQKNGRNIWLLKLQHNTFHFCILAISLAYRTELLSSECGRVNFSDIHWKDWYWSSNTLATWCEELTHLKTPWCWERLRTGGEGDDRGRDGWTASPTQWTWIWVNSGRWWWTGRLGVLQSTGSQRLGHNWATALNWTELATDILFAVRN